MEDQSLFTSSQPKAISEGLQNFIDAMVEEIVLEGKPFDTQKKYLRKFSENEGLDYDKLEADIITFIEILDSLKTAFSKLQVKLAEEKGKECHVSEGMVKKLVSHSSQKNQVEITYKDDSAVVEEMKRSEAQYVKKPKRSEVNGPIPKVNNKPKKSVLPWVIGLTAVAIVLLALWLPRYSESKEFASCMTVDDYRNYVANHPNGRHMEDALSYIENHVNDSIAQAEALRIEEEERAKKKCYEDAINMGKRKLEAKEFEEAKKAFAKAKDCPYFEKAVVDSWLAKCDTAKLEDLVCGEHLLSLQWISWDYFGRVKIEKESGGRYRCVGEQKSKENTDYLKLDGYITIISEKHLKFEGAIRSKVYHINGGREYCRKGTFDFKASGSRQYWREQKMNGADGCTDYVDIYFQKWKD